MNVIIGLDGLARCAWAGSAPEYLAYHDQEWGRPLRGDNELFERVSLEAFQSGLSWITILRKRPAFRAAFAGFMIERVAEFDESDVRRLLAVGPTTAYALMQATGMVDDHAVGCYRAAAR